MGRQHEARCVYCAGLVDVRKAGVSQLVTAWRMNRERGGANQVIMATPVEPYTYACKVCIDLKRLHVDPMQGKLGL